MSNGKNRVPHVLQGTIVGLGANQNEQVSIPTGGFTFVVRAIGARQLIAGVAQNPVEFNLNLTFSDTNKKLVSDLIPAELISGNGMGQEPYRIDGGPGGLVEQGIVISGQSTILVDVQDTSGSVSTITVALIGYRLEGASMGA